VKAYVTPSRVTGVTDFRDYLARNREAVQECLRRVRMLMVNRAAREFYGAPSKQKLWKISLTFSTSARLRSFVMRLSRCRRRVAIRAEFPVRTLDGESRLVTMNVSLVNLAATIGRE